LEENSGKISSQNVHINRVTYLINIIIGIKAQKSRPELKWFELNLIVAFIVQLWMRYLAYSSSNNLFLTHIYVALEFVLFSLFYRDIFRKESLFYRYFMPFVLLVLAAIVANTIFFEPLTVFSGNSKTLTQVIIIIYAVVCFFKRLDYEVREFVENNLPKFSAVIFSLDKAKNAAIA
jgi:hypothetical protein